ncbi:MAG TPA: type II secretion system major pseudopilin GspG [Gemmatimonadaceae bacterium]|nr:type II secretion system major pseudopilin GspG [Gemmatimonadaceae bacterium]
MIRRAARREALHMCSRGERWSAPRRQPTGFTLIELLVVIVVIGVLASLVAPNIFRHVGTAKETTARAQIEMLGAALDAYRLDTGRYPSTEQGLAALWEEPSPGTTNWRGPYLRKTVPADPWGNAYVYRAPGSASGTGYDLLSTGADGRPGGDGEDADVLSWK